MSHFQIVDDTQVGLAGRSGKVVMPPRILSENRVDQIRPKHGIQRTHHRLITNEEIARAARRTNSTAIFGVADQFSIVPRIFHHVAQRQAIVGIDLMVEAGKTIIIVDRLEHRLEIGKRRAHALRRRQVAAFRRKSKITLGLIDICNIVVEVRSVSGRLPTASTFVVQKEKRSVLADGAAESAAVLVLPQIMGQRRGLQKRARVGRAVL